MATAAGAQPNGLVAVSRAVVSAAAELAASVERVVVGDHRVRTAHGNAWAAICADRARAQARNEMDALVRAQLGDGRRPASEPGAAFVSQVKAPARPRRRSQSPARPRSQRSRRAVEPRHRAAAPGSELVSAGTPQP